MRRLAAVAMVLLLLHLPSASAYGGLVLSRGSVGEVNLVDQHGANFPLDSLEAPLLVVAFIYTSCPDVCPVITQTLKAVQNDLPAELEGKVDFISITVDPVRDNPETLLAFTELHGVTWPHLTGDEEVLEDVWERFGVAVQSEVIEAHAASPDFAAEAATVTHVRPNGTSMEHAFSPTGWNLTVEAAEEAGWNLTADDGTFGHMVVGIDGVASPEDFGWSWSLHVWNSTSEAWEESQVGVDGIDALATPHLAWVASNATALPPTPDGDASIDVVFPNGSTARQTLDTTSAHYLTLGSLGAQGVPLNLSLDPTWGHMLHGISFEDAPEDWSWWWRLAAWNETSNAWEEAMVGMDDLNDTLHIAWAPSTVNLSDVPPPGSGMEMEGNLSTCNGHGSMMGSGASAHCMCDEGYVWAENSRLSCVLDGTLSVGHSTMTFMLDAKRAPRIVWTGDGWSPDAFTADIEELARATGVIERAEAPTPGPSMGLVVLTLFGAALLVERRR